MLTFDQKVQCFAVSAKHLYWFELEENTFLIVPCDEIWVHYFTPQSRQSTME
jgi:hypothetical protein